MSSARILVLVCLTLASVFYTCFAATCELNSNCSSFEHCCKGKCTAKRLPCQHVCHTDHDCSQEERCVLGLCVNCSSHFPCEWKKCRNDTHCPSEHSCKNEQCEQNKPYSLTGEMAPFVIFIAALAVSLMIVCYNDYFLERIGHRGCGNYLRSINCNCRLTLWFWMWRLRRATDRNNQRCQPQIEVNFNSMVHNRPLRNEKSREWTCHPLSWISHRFAWFSRRENASNACVSLHEGGSSEESSENSQHCTIETSPVLLLNECSSITSSSVPVTHERVHDCSKVTETEKLPSTSEESATTSAKMDRNSQSGECGHVTTLGCVKSPEICTCQDVRTEANNTDACSTCTISSATDNICSPNSSTTTVVLNFIPTEPISHPNTTCSHVVTIV